MKIIMLGHSGVGKTTYMASMYGTLQTPINGFSLRAQDSTHHGDLLRVFKKIRMSQYPDPTVQRSQYDFFLLYEGKAVFPFQWVDYRGKALVERQDSSDEARRLVSELREASGIMLFCDSNAMSHGNAGSQVGRMMTLVGQALQNNDKPTTIAIVFTKADLVEKIDDELVQPVSGLLEAISKSETTVGTWIPVACGNEMIYTEVPVLFALHFGIVFQAMELAAEIEFWQQEQEYFVNKGNTLRGIFGNIRKSWNNQPTTYDQAKAAQKQAEEKRSEIVKLIEPAEQLSEYLKNFLSF